MAEAPARAYAGVYRTSLCNWLDKSVLTAAWALEAFRLVFDHQETSGWSSGHHPRALSLELSLLDRRGRCHAASEPPYRMHYQRLAYYMKPLFTLPSTLWRNSWMELFSASLVVESESISCGTGRQFSSPFRAIWYDYLNVVELWLPAQTFPPRFSDVFSPLRKSGPARRHLARSNLKV